jgi:3-hydroxyacyl-CoA dehydrogenase
VLATAAAFAKRLGKIGVLAGVCDGFIGNRIMSAYRHEADVLLEEGAEPLQVDRAMRDFGFAMGIFEMQDLAGLDIAWAMRKRRAAHTAAGADYVHIADHLCEAGRFGRKTDAGWYDYEGGSAKPSDLVAGVIAAARAAKGIAPRAFTEREIMDRIIGRMKTEAEAVLRDGIAQSAADIDVVMVNGYGFPRWRGGPSKC